MTSTRANKIYDILVNAGGANESMREAFVYHHTDKDLEKQGYFCTEWRFMGKLGFGGKYRSWYNTVDCYIEDETKERLKIIEEINNKLKEIK